MRWTEIPLTSRFVPVAAFFGADIQVLMLSALRQAQPAGIDTGEPVDGLARTEKEMKLGIDSELRHGFEGLDDLVAEACGRPHVLKCNGAAVTAVYDVKRLSELGELA